MMEPPVSFRGPVLLGLVALVGLVAGLGSWLFLARLDSAVILAGQVVVQDHRLVLEHPEGGLVAEVLVREGSRVAEGDPLLRLEGAELHSELGILDRRLASLSARKARLVAERDEADRLTFPEPLLALALADPEIEAELEGQRQHFELRLALFEEARKQLSLRVEQYRDQALGLVAQGEAVLAELALLQDDLARQDALFLQGLVAQSQPISLRREEARLQAQIAALAVAEAQTAGQITETELRISGLRTERRAAAAAELRELEPQVSELQEARRALAARVEQLVVRAPFSGTVLGLQVSRARAFLRAAEPILSLVPADQPLVVAARVRPEDIDAVAVGQPVELVVSAFAGSPVPRLRAEVTLVAADALADPATGETFYAVEVTLDPGEADRLGNRRLLPGMRVEAFVAVGVRSPMTYLLEPFTSFFDRALNES